MILTFYRVCRSIYRKMIGYPINTFRSVRALRLQKLIHGVRFEKDNIFFNFGLGKGLKARRFPHSDLHVLQQIIQHHEYGFAVEWVASNGLRNHPLRIIDAGANVGYTSVYFLSAFPNASILAIEPDIDNYQVLSHNLACCSAANPSLSLHAALLSCSGIAVTIDRQGGDKKDWSFSVRPASGVTGIKSVSVGDLLSQTGWEQVDILKIDIEGSEADVFSEQADLSYLAKTRLLLVEIHDDKADRKKIHQRLLAHGFSVEERSETTFAINKAFA